MSTIALRNIHDVTSFLSPVSTLPNLDQTLAMLISNHPKKVVVLDDDPTGTQTVHGVKIITQWNEGNFVELLNSPDRLFYVLTNSRSLPENEAMELTRKILTSLCRAAVKTKTQVSVISRGDSTLRGHFPAETHAAVETLIQHLHMEFHGQVIVPAFFEGGRYTFENVHWVKQGDWLIPVGETEFARDPAFAFQSSDLVQWVLEKAAGTVRQEAVIPISIDTLRNDGIEGVYQILKGAPTDAIFVCNAASYLDLKVLVGGFLMAEAEGRNYLYRTAASFVPIYGGIPLRNPLSRQELRAFQQATDRGGLVVVGSHVQKTTQQLMRLLRDEQVRSIEIRVRALLDPDTRDEEITRVVQEANELLAKGIDTVVYTTRTVLEGDGKESYLRIGTVVSDSLVKIVRSLEVQPRFLIAKGGITSSVLATDALGAEIAQVLGQILPGIPVWLMGPETTMPGKPYVVFPGNVGDENSLFEALQLLR